MGLIVLVFWLVLAAGLPDLLPRAFGLSAHAPDLWTALVVYLACRGRGYAAVGWGIVIGLLEDCHSLDPLGTHGFVLGLKIKDGHRQNLGLCGPHVARSGDGYDIKNGGNNFH